ncbi:uncharacterized protein SCDLUD_004483 [Saccharomycodes ludwigii]|uniref:uncharacterized protein n=1 Tax=Saccharomycodes ludwigii TaxID=36035 RepID=UPI001E8C5EA5|nr:hypothetical protein SCDLUD_004483 [Saccharomycodes ludwigii]KAH3899061.1 hypothetical protein SCDLUD_004483 [Saccharomycodes ludwigii]
MTDNNNNRSAMPKNYTRLIFNQLLKSDLSFKNFKLLKKIISIIGLTTFVKVKTFRNQNTNSKNLMKYLVLNYTLLIVAYPLITKYFLKKINPRVKSNLLFIFLFKNLSKSNVSTTNINSSAKLIDSILNYLGSYIVNDTLWDIFYRTVNDINNNISRKFASVNTNDNWWKYLLGNYLIIINYNDLLVPKNKLGFFLKRFMSNVDDKFGVLIDVVFLYLFQILYIKLWKEKILIKLWKPKKINVMQQQKKNKDKQVPSMTQIFNTSISTKPTTDTHTNTKSDRYGIDFLITSVQWCVLKNVFHTLMSRKFSQLKKYQKFLLLNLIFYLLNGIKKFEINNSFLKNLTRVVINIYFNKTNNKNNYCGNSIKNNKKLIKNLIILLFTNVYM